MKATDLVHFNSIKVNIKQEPRRHYGGVVSFGSRKIDFELGDTWQEQEFEQVIKRNRSGEPLDIKVYADADMVGKLTKCMLSFRNPKEGSALKFETYMV